MEFIQLSSVYFASSLFSMSMSATRISSSIREWESTGEKSKAIDAYITAYLNIQYVMKSYKELVKKDIEAIKKVGEEMVKTDAAVAGLWK